MTAPSPAKCDTSSDRLRKPVNLGVVGVLGGMGSYSTLHFFKALLDRYDVEKEWERPRIVVDNNCVLPSRVRAILYDERRRELVEGMASAIRALSCYQPDVIVIPCHTAHCFLSEVRQRLAHEGDAILDMINEVASELQSSRASDVMLIATEGTIDTRIYDSYCEPRGIRVRYPNESQMNQTREFIEQVKQCQPIDPDQFVRFLVNLNARHVILGCTELSVIPTPNSVSLADCRLIDPIRLMVNRIHDRIGEVCRQRPGPLW